MGLSKANLDYWKSRLTQRNFTRKNGESYKSPDYAIRLSLDGDRIYFPLETPNKEKAAQKAREIWEFSRVNGTEATLQKFKPEGLQINANGYSNQPTVGDLFKAHEELHLINPRTLHVYRRKLRTLVAGIIGLNKNLKKVHYRDPQFQKWKERVDGYQIKNITPAKILRWRAAYLDRVPKDPISQRSAQITISSILRNAKSLFGKKYKTALPFKLDHDPFQGIPIGTATTQHYRSTINFKKLAEDAMTELRPAIPKKKPSESYKEKLLRQQAESCHEQFKILILALGCGLRRAEIDALLWENIDFTQGIIHVTTTDAGGLKSDDSERSTDVDETILSIFKTYQKSATSRFVIESTVKTRTGSTYYHYRSNKHFKKLINWLRHKGVNKNKALHSMRAEYGSQICQQFGIYAASRALGHSNVTITAASYLDKREKVSVSLF